MTERVETEDKHKPGLAHDALVATLVIPDAHLSQEIVGDAIKTK